jgi:hypothetical protein
VESQVHVYVGRAGDDHARGVRALLVDAAQIRLGIYRNSPPLR